MGATLFDPRQWSTANHWGRRDSSLVSMPSEFYQARRKALADAGLVAGFVVGLIASAFAAWPWLSTRYARDNFGRGVGYFVVILLVGAAITAAIGVWAGTVSGRLWERRHRRRRGEARRPVLGREVDEAVTRREALAPPVVLPASEIRYQAGFDADAFVALAERVWPRGYDRARVAAALARTINIGAWSGDGLVGSVRVLTDSYLFSVVAEILVDPAYRRRGVGRELMRRALEESPRGALFLGAQPQARGFFERIGCEPGPVGMVLRKSPAMGTRQDEDGAGRAG